MVSVSGETPMYIDCYVTLGNERETVYSAASLVEDLDRAGVDMAVIAPSDREIAVNNKDGNIRIAREASRYPGRLIPACTVNPWYGGDGVAELARAVDNGAKMLVFHPTLQGFLINDDLADPLLAFAAESGIPVYVHTGPHLYGSPWQVVDCALRFPEAYFIMGHAGATDFWNDIPSAGCIAPNVYIEGSFARPFIFRNHVKYIGASRGLMGSSAPRNDLVYEWKCYRAEMPGPEYDPVFGDNLARILPDGGRP